MSADQKELIELALSTALEQDGTKLFNLYQEHSWDNPSLFNREQYGVCTILNGYKLAFQYSPDCITIEVRPENGIGYYVDVITSGGMASEEGDYSIGLSSCACTNWQWNGVFNRKIYTASQGTDLTLYGEQNGTIKEGLREGVFEGTHTKHNYHSSELYQDGILIEYDGRTIENPSTIGGIITYGGAKELWLDALYW